MKEAGLQRKILIQMEDAIQNKVNRASLSCGNLAHAFAGCDLHEKSDLKGEKKYCNKVL